MRQLRNGCLVLLALLLLSEASGVLADTSIPCRVYLPIIVNNWPLPVYEGLTDQGRPISLEIEPDLSAVRTVTINMRFSCDGATLEGTISVINPSGWPIENRSFTAETKYFIVKGTFAVDFNTVNGTWQGIATVPWVGEICRGPVGTWSASRK